MKILKCTAAFLLALIFILNLASCSGGSKNAKDEKETDDATESDKNSNSEEDTVKLYEFDDTFTDFIRTQTNIDDILGTKYTKGMPLGYNDLIFSFYQSGWGFNNSSIHANITLNTMSYDDSTLIKTGWSMPVTVKLDGKSVFINNAEFTPSYVTSRNKEGSEVAVTGYKYVSSANIIAVIIEVENNSAETVTASVDSYLGGNTVDIKEETDAIRGTFRRDSIDVLDILAKGDGFTVSEGYLKSDVEVKPGESYTFRLCASFDRKAADEGIIKAFFNDKDPLATQRISFNNWFEYNIPYIDLPDEDIEKIYYYRWHTYRSQIRTNINGNYLITEFLPNVAWARTDNAIVCAAGHHIYEGRWLRDQKYMDDYMGFWFGRGQSAIYLYSSWLPEAYYQRYLTTGDTKITEYYTLLERFYNHFTATHFDAEVGLFKINGGSEGMESSISDPNNKFKTFRPTFNSYMYANALAIAEMARINGNEAKYNEYVAKAESIKVSMEKLWDGSFYRAWHDDADTYVDVRELIGYAPWMFNMPDDDAEHAEIWKYLMDPDYFYAQYGPLTAERGKANLVLDPNRHCRWDGPSWPFATSQTLIAMDNLLNNYENQSYITKDDYYTLLRNYALTHYKDTDGDGVRETPWIGESLLGDSGEWIQITERSSYYNHSQYTNLVITGLLGITPSDSNVLEIKPLIPEDWEYFCLENLPYHGRNITVVYDKDGTRYGGDAGFNVYVDGKLVASSETVGEIAVNLE